MYHILINHINKISVRNLTSNYNLTIYKEFIFLFSSDVNKIQDGIGDKIGNFFQWFSCSIVGFIIGFVYGWKLTLVVMAFAPLLAISGGLMMKVYTNVYSRTCLLN